MNRPLLAIAGAVVLMIWTVVIVLGESPVYALLVTLLAVIGVTTSALLEVRQARRGARMLESDLRSQAENELASARPDVSTEIAAMRDRFIASLAELRSSKLGKQGFDALYAMPWYMIVGPPGSGKTTAIANSGLQFPVHQRDGAMSGLGGTRNCQWWLANEAVLLDTAGRYATEDDDHAEWLAFLDLLRRSRPRKPIEGVLVAIGVDEIGAGDEDAAAERARQLRARIDEIMGRLDMVAPVYVLFTKCDLIPGFIELFGELSKQERAQIWGFTVPADRRAGEAWSAGHFEGLCAAASAYALRRLPGIRQPGARLLAHGLPAQLQALADNMRAFVNSLFAENVYQETPLMRGCYLTSGTQEGRPVDRLLSSIAGAFNMRASLGIEASARDRKSYFLSDVFTRIIFPDRALAVRSSREQRRARNVQIAGSAALGALAIAIAGFSLRAQAADAQWIARARAIAEAARPGATTDAEGPQAELIRLIAELEAHHELRSPLAARLGLDHGEALADALQRLLAAERRLPPDRPERPTP